MPEGASSTSALPWTVRVTPRESHDDLAELRKVLAGLGGAHLIVREYGDVEDNLHYHACFYTEVKQPRTRFATAFGKVGNGVYSLKRCKDEGMIRYILKGSAKHPEPRGDPPDVITRYGFSLEKIKEYHDAYWSQSEKVKASKDLSWTKQIEHYMVQNAMEFTWENTTDAVLDMYLKYKNTVDKMTIVKVAQHIMATRSAGFKNALRAELHRARPDFISY